MYCYHIYVYVDIENKYQTFLPVQLFSNSVVLVFVIPIVLVLVLLFSPPLRGWLSTASRLRLVLLLHRLLPGLCQPCPRVRGLDSSLVHNGPHHLPQKIQL